MAFINELNEIQQKLVKTIEGPILIVAGAGSGKTRVLTYKVAYLISINIPSYHILSLTFTNKAANEMIKRIYKLVGEKSSKLWTGTFHSIFARILRYEAKNLGYNSNFTIYDIDDSQDLIKTIQHTLKLSTQVIKPSSVRLQISNAKNNMISPKQFANLAKDFFEEKVALIYSEYQKLLKKNNAMDFDDLLLKPIELFEHEPKILEKYQDRFRFILIDEYQDTNRAQYILIKLLAKKYRNICVVGDDAQSIYGFRGAEIKNILDFEKDFPDCKIFRLEQNYRSTQLILSAANQVIKNNSMRIDKNLWTKNEKGEKICVIAAQDEKEEGNKIAEQIKKSINGSKIDFKNIVVLYRTNAQSRSIEDALRKNSIPYVIVGGVEFYKRKEIKDVLAYLRLIVNPNDDVSFCRIVNYPTRGIGDTSIGYLKKYCNALSCSLFDAAKNPYRVLGLSTKSAEKIKNFSNFIMKYKNLKSHLSVGELSRALIDELGILKDFQEERTPESIARWENIQELLSAIDEYSKNNENSSLENFLQEVSLVADVDRWEDTNNAVTLMTLHNVKGLEFDTVFITGLEEGLFPIFSSSLTQDELEEERRLFYVGMTRAMRKLFLCYSIKRFRYGDANYTTPSRFLKEINEQLLEYLYSNEFQIRTPSIQLPKVAEISKQIRQQMPDYENESQIFNDLRVGLFINHDVFGRGKIVGISGHGKDLRALIDFDVVGRKNIMVKYAPIKLM